VSRARAIATFLLDSGVPNYFGPQRFGTTNLTDALRWAQAGLPRTRRFQLKLWPSVLQAEVFNRYLTRRCELGCRRLIDGEVVRLDGTSRCFVVDAPERELLRLIEGDIHLTGPIFGPKATRAARNAAELEQEALAALGLPDASLQRLGKLAAGTRRDLFMEAPSLRIEPESDTVFRVLFSLPAGGYATRVMSEITGAAER
jgi:tRNA pseudouridine13 synthase